MISLHTESLQEVLLVTATGDVDLGSAVQMFEETTDLAARKNVTKILVDGRLLSGELSTSERYELAVKVIEHLLQLATYPNIAFVGHPPTFSGFGVFAAHDRGANMQLFPNLPQAFEWLRKPSNPEIPER